ncbi:hypothetical protein BJV82DRAFT_663078 [Fennellomyces sp. T-0311]|nr:hypothetical protein BJV82DRAFT_663078 [Fennellomyces sp. T-0311]
MLTYTRVHPVQKEVTPSSSEYDVIISKDGFLFTLKVYHTKIVKQRKLFQSIFTSAATIDTDQYIRPDGCDDIVTTQQFSSQGPNSPVNVAANNTPSENSSEVPTVRETTPGFIRMFPPELLFEIFKRMELFDFVTCVQVCQTWQTIL